MKKFLAIYLGTPATLEKSGWNKMDEAERKKREASGIKAWMDWGRAQGRHRRPRGSSRETKRTSTEGVADVRTT